MSNFGPKNKMWGEAHRSKYLTTASNYFHNPSTGTIADQIMSGGLLEDVQTFSPTRFLDVRGSVTRYDNTNSINSRGINPTSVGFPGYLASNSTVIALPQITFSDSGSPLNIGNTFSGTNENFDTIQLFASLTKVHGAHSFLIGADIRANKGSYFAAGAADGTFAFNKGNGNPVA